MNAPLSEVRLVAIKREIDRHRNWFGHFKRNENGDDSLGLPTPLPTLAALDDLLAEVERLRTREAAMCKEATS